MAISFTLAISAQDENRVLGTWISNYGDSKITIKKDFNGFYYGEISWLKDPNNKLGLPKVDDKNPNVNLRTRAILGLFILKGFTYDKKDKEWEGGKIYDPKEGKTYKCYMWFDKDPNKLNVRGYIGFSLIGREVVWTRE